MSLGKDLATIRNGLGLSLEEVQSIVKIPVHTLKSIESDGIFDDPEYNTTYTRSFIRSYARALKINDALVVDALDAVEGGLYVPGNLLDRLDVQKKPIIKPDMLDEAEESESIFKEPDIKTAPQKPTPTVENIDWVNLGKNYNTNESRPKILGAVLIIAGIVLAGVLIFIYRVEIASIFSSNDEPVETAEIQQPALSNEDILSPAIAEQETGQQSTENTMPEVTAPPAQTVTDETDTETEPEATQPAAPAQNPFVGLYSPTLGDTLILSVFAAYDKLEPVRVTSDFNWRTNPFWMEQGQAFNFNFQDTILVRGQYSRMMLLFNGHIIENPGANYLDDEYDSVMLTREILSNGGYLSVPPSTLPADVIVPDSLVFPLSY